MTSPGSERGGFLHELDIVDPRQHDERAQPGSVSSVPIDIPPSKTPTSHDLGRRRTRLVEAARQSMDAMDMRISIFTRSNSNMSAFSANSSSGSHGHSHSGMAAADDRGSSGLVPLSTPDNPTRHHPWQGEGGQGGRDEKQQMVSPSAGSSNYFCGSPPREDARRQQQRGSFNAAQLLGFDPSSGGGGGGGGDVDAARGFSSYTYAVGSHLHRVTINDDDVDGGESVVSGRYSTPRQHQHYSSRSRGEDEDRRFDDGYGYAAKSAGAAAAAAGARARAGATASSRSGGCGARGYSRPWSHSGGRGPAAAAAAAVAANPARAGRGGFSFAPGGGGGQQVGHARGLVYAEEQEEGDGHRTGRARRRGGVHGVDSDEEGVGAGEETDEDDVLADGVFNMELSES
eukprot:g10490.t1